ncbi:MAG: hypothetical protein LBE75_06095 [Burkholderiales bacterium]|jgi:hypothetical protein|nr:hypothetical protein [Burkholderiales bacterium]
MRLLERIKALLMQRDTKAGYLVEIDQPTPLRFSSFGAVTWDGKTWLDKVFVKLERSDRAPYALAGELTLADPDWALSVLIDRNGLAGRLVRIWYVADHTMTEEPVQVFDGFADAWRDVDAGIAITLAPDDGQALYVPAQRFTLADYPYVLQPGSILKFNGSETTIEGLRYQAGVRP